MVFHSKGVVLRTVPYGETSIIALIYTELFGIQSYLINGVRTNKKSAVKGNLFQPAALLDMEVYHNELKNLQRIKEAKWHYLYQQVFFNIYKNAVAVFMTELLQKVLKQPETNADLYNFIEDAYIQLDQADAKTTSNYPAFFALHLTEFLGSRIQDNYTAITPILDLQEGRFIQETPAHYFYSAGETAHAVSLLLKALQPHEAGDIILNNITRRQVLDALMQFYILHVNDFGTMRSLPVLKEVLA
ncbi:DNA repair protein RecO [Terrimonas sp.]|uniref:DNA repair protein RecO n=1 Tax=Terrimonas sp. TaxID=1914338 RepID=UPI000D5116EF|nr:DNA repair protein RecO [Terrimonas sp.]PVD52637.1 DNA repair protein RecO [Terrimonas sp.]